MIQDQSEDFQETWQFLDNRLQGVHDVSDGVEQVHDPRLLVLETVDWSCVAAASSSSCRRYSSLQIYEP